MVKVCAYQKHMFAIKLENKLPSLPYYVFNKKPPKWQIGNCIQFIINFIIKINVNKPENTTKKIRYCL